MNKPINPGIATADNLIALELPATEMEVEVTFAEAVQGTSRILSIKDPALCTDCIKAKQCNRKECAHCFGQGYVHTYRQVEINLPIGVSANEKIRFQGLGPYNLGAQKNTDLIVRVSIRQRKHIEFIERNCICTLVMLLLDSLPA